MFNDNTTLMGTIQCEDAERKLRRRPVQCSKWMAIWLPEKTLRIFVSTTRLTNPEPMGHPAIEASRQGSR